MAEGIAVGAARAVPGAAHRGTSLPPKLSAQTFAARFNCASVRWFGSCPSLPSSPLNCPPPGRGFLEPQYRAGGFSPKSGSKAGVRIPRSAVLPFEAALRTRPWCWRCSGSSACGDADRASTPNINMLGIRAFVCQNFHLARPHGRPHVCGRANSRG